MPFQVRTTLLLALITNYLSVFYNAGQATKKTVIFLAPNWLLHSCNTSLSIRLDMFETTCYNIGGFVNVGETVENAVLREVHEETNLFLLPEAISQFRTVSDPKRDHRRHTVSVVFRCIATDSLGGLEGGEGGQILRSGDDAKAVEVVPLRSVLNLNLAFDHRSILKAYIEEYHSTLTLDREKKQNL